MTERIPEPEKPKESRDIHIEALKEKGRADINSLSDSEVEELRRAGVKRL